MAHTIVYGGTFDPIHHGHLLTAQRARELLAADRVLFIPANISPHKRATLSAAADHRMAMLHAAIANQPYFFADGRELARQGVSYTIDTLTSLHEESPADMLTLLIGADQLLRLHTWHLVQEWIVGIPWLRVSILGRPGNEFEAGLAAVRINLGEPIANALAKAVLPTPLIDISATDIRNRVLLGMATDFLTPAAVIDYIRAHGLYQSR